MINTLNEMMLQNGIGVFYLDDRINVLGANQTASEILQCQDEVWQSGSQLHFKDSGIKKKLIMIIQNLANGSSSFFIKRSLDKPPLKVSVFSCQDNIRGNDGAKAVSIVLMKDTQKKQTLCIESIAEHYSLTNAEASLVHALYDGKTLQQHACDRGIKITTARWTLDNVFSKTYTCSQSELKELAYKFSE